MFAESHCGGRVKLRGRVNRTGRHLGGSVHVPFRGLRSYLRLSGRQGVNQRAPLLFVTVLCFCQNAQSKSCELVGGANRGHA